MTYSGAAIAGVAASTAPNNRVARINVTVGLLRSGSARRRAAQRVKPADRSSARAASNFAWNSGFFISAVTKAAAKASLARVSDA